MTEQSYGGRYTALERVGSGGMAEVYRARDELLGREVALKILSDRLSQDPTFVERFRREAQSAANLNHPNIVSLFDYGADDGASFIVMEFIDGRSLDQILAQEGKLMPERAAEIASDVAKALDRAHQAGIVHRDIKPGNIMVTKSGQTKVTDFGIARAVGGDRDATMTQTGMVLGTAAYLSPEQAQGNPIDARTDVYALGCVLYEMLAGQAPFSGETPLAIAYKHVREEPQRLGELNPDVPQSLEQIIKKAMAKNPENRYRDAGELEDDLARFLSGQKVHATPMLADETRVAPAAGSGTQVMRETTVYDEPEERRAGFYVAVTLAALVVFGLLAWLLASMLLGGGDIEVPKVTGMTVDEATKELRELGLDWEIERKASRKPVNEVVAQDPEAGDMVSEGDTVLLTVSSGLEQVEVPELVGLSLEDAEQELKDAGLRLGEVTEEENPDFEPNEVTQQSIQPGIEVDARTKVNVTVASGTVTVPSVVGFSQEEAEEQLTTAGFDVEVSTEASDQEEGTVIAQDPPGGTEAERGDTVRILVSEGQSEQPMPNVTGQDGDDAEAFLESEYGLNVEQVEETEACAEPPGVVCRQDPEPDTPVSEGDSATLYVQGGGAAAPDTGGEGVLDGWFVAFLFHGLA